MSSQAPEIMYASQAMSATEVNTALSQSSPAGSQTGINAA
jgi:hypothetical protein